MSKEVLLKKAYDAATVNDVVRRGDDKVSFDIIRNAMVTYAQKNNVDITVEEIEEYIKCQDKKIDEITADFNIQTKIMK